MQNTSNYIDIKMLEFLTLFPNRDMWNHGRTSSGKPATTGSSIDEDDNVFADDVEINNDNKGTITDNTLRRVAAGRQYGYTGPLADIVGAANRLKSVPADHDLRVLKSHQRQPDVDQDDGGDNIHMHNSTRPHIVDDIIHKTILVGDSGVGKTSLLVQFDTGKFNLGAFSATVGIGFTVSLIKQFSVSDSNYLNWMNPFYVRCSV